MQKKLPRLRKTLVQRSADLISHFGGGEFSIILSNTNELGAVQVAEKVRLEGQKLTILHNLFSM